MPVLTIASAVSRINPSLTLHANLFQLFHPIGGVRASCEEFALEDSDQAVLYIVTRRTLKTTNRTFGRILIATHLSLPERVSIVEKGADSFWRNFQIIRLHNFDRPSERNDLVQIEVLVQVQAEKLRGLRKGHGKIKHIAKTSHAMVNRDLREQTRFDRSSN